MKGDEMFKTRVAFGILLNVFLQAAFAKNSYSVNFSLNDEKILIRAGSDAGGLSGSNKTAKNKSDYFLVRLGLASFTKNNRLLATYYSATRDTTCQIDSSYHPMNLKEADFEVNEKKKEMLRTCFWVDCSSES